MIGGLVAIISALPLAWIGPRIVPSHIAQDSQFSGTIWQGHANIPFGKSRAPVTFKTMPLKLITGQNFLDFTVQNSGFNLKGLGGFGRAQNIEIDASIPQLPLRDPRIRGLKGRINAQISSAKFGARCKAISGQATTDFLQANEATWFWRGPALSGPIRCEDGHIIVDMTGQDASQSFAAELRLQSDGVYTAQMQVDTSDARAAIVLGFYGFEARGTQFVLSETGRWY